MAPQAGPVVPHLVGVAAEQHDGCLQRTCPIGALHKHAVAAAAAWV